MKRNAVVVVIVIVVAVVAFFIGQNTAVAPKSEGKMEGERGPMLKSAEKRFVGAEKHEITLDEAKKLIQNHWKSLKSRPGKEKGALTGTTGGSFDRVAIEKVLSQPGCDKLRFYYAAENNGAPTLVLVGVDSSGNDMTKASMMEKVWPCPPWCSSQSELLR